jgi:hypothetical protein
VTRGRSETCLILIWTLFAGIFVGYILFPVLAPQLMGTPQMWLAVGVGTGVLLLLLLCLLMNIKRGAVHS